MLLDVGLFALHLTGSVANSNSSVGVKPVKWAPDDRFSDPNNTGPWDELYPVNRGK
jgi:hypothetical protein